jgi:hypothetical protein
MGTSIYLCQFGDSFWVKHFIPQELSPKPYLFQYMNRYLTIPRKEQIWVWISSSPFNSWFEMLHIFYEPIILSEKIEIIISPPCGCYEDWWNYVHQHTEHCAWYKRDHNFLSSENTWRQALKNLDHDMILSTINV